MEMYFFRVVLKVLRIFHAAWPVLNLSLESITCQIKQSNNNLQLKDEAIIVKKTCSYFIKIIKQDIQMLKMFTIKTSMGGRFFTILTRFFVKIQDILMID